MEVMSPFAPEAAAPRLDLAPLALFEPVPPLATGSCPVNVILPALSRAMLPEAETATVPEAFGITMVRLAVGVAKLTDEVLPPLLAVIVELAFPWTVKLWAGLPTVNELEGVMLLTVKEPEIVVVPVLPTVKRSVPPLCICSKFPPPVSFMKIDETPVFLH